MADENSQNQAQQTQTTAAGVQPVPASDAQPVSAQAPMPEWLKQVQGLQTHEEKGAPLIQQGYDPVHGNFGNQPGAEQPTLAAEPQGTAVAPAATGTSTSSNTSLTQAAAVSSEAIVPSTNPSEVKAALQGDSPLPLWLQKASAKPLSAPGVAAENTGLPGSGAALTQTLSQAPVPTAAQPAVQAPAPAPAQTVSFEPKKDAFSQFIAASQQVQQVQEAPVPSAETPAPAGATSVVAVAPQQVQQPAAPIPGLLETKVAQDDHGVSATQPSPALSAQPAAPVAASVSPVGSPASSTVAPASAPTVNQTPASSSAPSPAAPAPGQEKKAETMQSVKKGMFSFLDFGKKVAEKSAVAIQAGKSAGAPEVPKPLPPAEAAKKAAVDKATAAERQKLIEAEKVYQQGLTTIRDLISPSSMEIQYDKLRVEGLFAQTFFVHSYPRYLDTNWLSPVVNFDVTMDIAQFIYPIDSAAIMSVLKKKVAQMQSSIRIAEEKGIVRDPALETALEDAEELRTQIQRGQEKFFQFGLYFTIYGEDDKKLEKISKQLESLLGGKLILTKKSELQMEHGFNSTLPLCLDELEVNRNMNTSPLSSTFPFSSSDLTSNEGILYGLNRHNDSLIIFDRFSLENANSVVFAKSGAGKSYCVKLEILRYLMLGTDVIVIDPENEYEALAQTVGGAYLKVSLTSDRRINPFDLPAALQDEELQPGDLLRSNIINLHGLLKIMLGGVTPLEEGILDKALNDVYAVKGITMDMVDPSNLPVPTMEDLYDILNNMEGGQNLAQRLQKYTQGTYAGIFNKPTNVDLNSGLMVFSIRDLEDALRPTAMYIILNFIWNRVRSKLKKRLLVIDEAWTMMQFEDSAKFLFGLVKRARKYYLGITTITQDVEDFVKSPYGKPVVTNSSMQLLLKQAPSAIEVLSKTFNLTEGEKYMLLNSGVGQGLFFAGLKHVAVQIIASYTEDKIVTTNPEEILRGRTGEQQFQTNV